MSTGESLPEAVAAPQSQPALPMLAVCLEQLHHGLTDLHEVTTQYNEIKRLVQLAQAADGSFEAELLNANFTLQIGASVIPMPMFESREQVLGLLQQAQGQLGAYIANLWFQLHEVTARGAQHCQTAIDRTQVGLAEVNAAAKPPNA